jgi:hypothetical protein
MSQTLCPDCGTSALVQTSTATPFDRLRRLFTSSRPHHCRKCGWTGWVAVSRRRRHAHAWTVERDPPDLGTLDAALTAAETGGTGESATDGANSPQRQ